MLLLPFRKVIFHSEINQQQLVDRLDEQVELFAGFRFDNYRKTQKSFVGKTGESSFDIRPSFKGQNSFAPCVHGTLQKQDTGTLISITMRLHYFTILFGLSFFIVLPLYQSARYHQPSGIIISLLFYIGTVCFFNNEANKMQSTLQMILEAQVKH